MKAELNNNQIAKFYAMLRNAGMKEQKEILIYSFTNERTASIKEVHLKEYRDIIKYLSDFDTCKKMRSKIFAILFQMGWIVDSNDPDEWKINYAKINSFLIRKGAVKRKFYDLNCKEVEKVLRQFESIQKHDAESKERREAEESFRQVINELGIKTIDPV